MNILIADDRPLLRDEIAFVLRSLFGSAASIRNIADFDTLEATLAESAPDLVVVHHGLRGAPETDALVRRLKRRRVMPLLVAGDDDPAEVRLALAAGAEGYLPRSAGSTDLRDALTTVISGGIFMPKLARRTAVPAEVARVPAHGSDHSVLTPRQREVLGLVRHGLPNKEIARRLGTTEGTIKNHVKAILRLLRVQNRTQAALARV